MYKLIIIINKTVRCASPGKTTDDGSDDLISFIEMLQKSVQE